MKQRVQSQLIKFNIFTDQIKTKIYINYSMIQEMIKNEKRKQAQ